MPVIKKQTVEIEKKLISEINALEQETLSENINIFDKKKLELENITGETIRFAHVYNGWVMEKNTLNIFFP